MAGVSPAVEPGVPPGGKTHLSPGRSNYLRVRLKSGFGPGGKMPPSTAGGTPAATKKLHHPGGTQTGVRLQPACRCRRSVVFAQEIGVGHAGDVIADRAVEAGLADAFARAGADVRGAPGNGGTGRSSIFTARRLGAVDHGVVIQIFVEDICAIRGSVRGVGAVLHQGFGLQAHVVRRGRRRAMRASVVSTTSLICRSMMVRMVK